MSKADYAREEPQRVTRTRSWDRAVVFDPKDNSVDIRKKKDMDKISSKLLQLNWDWNEGRHLLGNHRYQQLELPKGRKKVSLFMDQDDKMRLKTDEKRSGDDVFLARLNLSHLGLTNWALFSLGYLSTLYVSTDLK
ncbi:hypothetical protein N0V83_000169 [Neocucurbitaria cava]|uniref:Uncharacterized protein n=1 Tax=Neocucurbitaria cava TaxID=798079 RepID=A0A9W8YGR3_9PLEO|nr:hypothetical protein N0V83_000169 [Neocucurbitaria cava]